MTAAAENLESELAETGLRVRIDDRTDVGLGRRLTDWELKGVPVRVEIGPRDLAQGTVSIARRDGTDRETVSSAMRSRRRATPCSRVHDALFAQAAAALEIRNGGRRRSRRRDRSGPFRVCSAALGRLRPGGRAAAQRRGPVRAVPDAADGSVPATADAADLYAIVARAY